MSQSNIVISGERRLATEERTRVDADGHSYDEHFQHVVPTAMGAVPKLLSAYLEASNSADMAVNGSVTAVAYELAPPSTEVYRIDRIAIVLVCAGAIEMTKLGDLAALTNGLLLSWEDEDGEVVDLLADLPIKSLNDMAVVFDVGVAELGTSHTVRALVHLPTPLRLDGGAGGLLRATVRDNLTTLTRLRIHALGSVEDLV